MRTIAEARDLANELNELLREDSCHRLSLYQKYSQDPDALKWTPDLTRRTLLADALYKKLDSLLCRKDLLELRKVG